MPRIRFTLAGLDTNRRDYRASCYKLVRSYCYHPEFHGSFSLKSVLPALVPGLRYGDLDISDGYLASLAYAKMVLPGTAPERRRWLRDRLLAYCKRDTEALVRLFEALMQGKPPGDLGAAAVTIVGECYSTKLTFV